MVRICLSKGNLQNVLPVVERCKELGMEVSINVTRMSRYTGKELNELTKILAEHSPSIICFADSNGSMLPTEISSIYKKFTRKYDVKFGFHAHDNLGLAQANSIAALHAGAQIIDVSLAGMGKGVGNLKAEFFIAYLHAIGIDKYDIEVMRLASNQVKKNHKIKSLINKNDFLMGIADLSIDDIVKLEPNRKLAVSATNV